MCTHEGRLPGCGTDPATSTRPTSNDVLLPLSAMLREQHTLASTRGTARVAQHMMNDSASQCMYLMHFVRRIRKDSWLMIHTVRQYHGRGRYWKDSTAEWLQGCGGRISRTCAAARKAGAG